MSPKSNGPDFDPATFPLPAAQAPAPAPEQGEAATVEAHGAKGWLTAAELVAIDGAREMQTGRWARPLLQGAIKMLVDILDGVTVREAPGAEQVSRETATAASFRLWKVCAERDAATARAEQAERERDEALEAAERWEDSSQEHAQLKEEAQARVRDLEGAIEGAPHMPWCRVSPCTCWKSRTLATPSTPAPAADPPGPGLREAAQRVVQARDALAVAGRAAKQENFANTVEGLVAYVEAINAQSNARSAMFRAIEALRALSAAAPPPAPPEPLTTLRTIAQMIEVAWGHALPPRLREALTAAIDGSTTEGRDAAPPEGRSGGAPSLDCPEYRASVHERLGDCGKESGAEPLTLEGLRQICEQITDLVRCLPYQKHSLAADGRTLIPSVYPILNLGEDEQAFTLLSAAPECVRVVQQTDEQAAMVWAQFGALSVEASAPRKEEV